MCLYVHIKIQAPHGVTIHDAVEYKGSKDLNLKKTSFKNKEGQHKQGYGEVVLQGCLCIWK